WKGLSSQKWSFSDASRGTKVDHSRPGHTLMGVGLGVGVTVGVGVGGSGVGVNSTPMAGTILTWGILAWAMETGCGVWVGVAVGIKSKSSGAAAALSSAASGCTAGMASAPAAL